MKEYPVLYGTGSTGKIKIFKIKVLDDPLCNSDVCQIVMEFGQEGGKLAKNCRLIETGKNIGKSNETTPYEQACNDAQSKWQKKKDEGYTETKKAQQTQELLLPMLALKYEERKHDIVFPCYVQPKLDGVRCITTSDGDLLTYHSRQGKEFNTLHHLNEEVQTLMDCLGAADIPDGEIYCHEELTFQEIIAAVKKENDETPKLKYYIYDTANPNKTFKQRNEDLVLTAQGIGEMNNIVIVPTYEVNNEAEIIKYHNQFVKEGYEGVIIRNANGKYTFKHRSKDLQKWKYFKDKEFTITGGKEATGEDKGTVVFICDAGNGKTFECRPRGSRELRKRWFKDLEYLKGSRLTVRFQELTDDGLPRFPVGIAVRDYE